MTDLLERAAELRKDAVAFAMATVVRSKRPASARPGDRALVLADGSMVGWVGGSCAQSTIAREALKALADGKPRLVRLSPDVSRAGEDDEGVVSYPMTCHSGGTLEIYVEPSLPPPRLVVIGESPVAQALEELAPPLEFKVVAQREATAALPSGAPERTWVVVAGMGAGDEEALESALRAGVAYVALVASPKRASKVVEELEARGVAAEARARLRAPAGLDIGAATGPEIALSILAEMVRLRREQPAGLAAAEVVAEEPALTSIDPVCGMEVEVATATLLSEWEGRTIYFCAPGCKRRFDRDPAGYLSAGLATP